MTTPIRSALLAVALVGAVVTASPGASSGAPTDPTDLPLLTIDDMSYSGAFALPAATFGESNMNYAEGPIEYADGTIFVVGHSHQNAIAQFEVPALVESTSIADLATASAPIQPFVTVLDRASGGNPQGLNRISGMEVHGGQLIVNAYEYYDAPADNDQTTLVVSNADDLDGADVTGFANLAGAARSAGWITELPSEWQPTLGGSHVVGHSSGIPIIGRASVGPSAHIVDGDDLLGAVPGGTIETSRALEFSLAEPLQSDLSNTTGTNDLWTHLSRARFGFVVPGTRTYLTLGSSGGHDSGVGYKITQDDGNLCGGYCSYEAADNSNYYWLWDLDDLLDVQAGTLAPSEVRPYDAGPLDIPFQTDGFNPIGGGTFDAATGTLYLTVLRANNEVGRYSNPPIVVAYRFPAIDATTPEIDPLATGCEEHTDSIVRLYAAAFGRNPDAGGFRFWFREYRAGRWSLPAMASFFASSPEFEQRYGAPTDAEYVDQLYRNALGRGSDAGGRAYWIDRMAAGSSRGDVLLMFAESPENIERTGTATPILGPFNRGLDQPLTCG